MCNNETVAVNRSEKWERIGACASALCAVHCVLTGAAFGLLSVAGLSFLRQPWLEELFLATTAGLGLWAMRHGLRRHGSWIPSIFFVIGLVLVVVKHIAIGHESTGSLGILLPIAGSLCLVLFFLLNAQLPHKSCGCFAETRCAHHPN